MTKLIVAFLNFATAPEENSTFIKEWVTGTEPVPIQLQVHMFFTILPRHTAPVWWRVVVGIGKLPSAFTPSQEAQGTYGKCAPLNPSRHDTSQYNNDLQKRASQWNYQRAQKSAHLRKGTSWCSNRYSNDIHNSDAFNTTQRAYNQTWGLKSHKRDTFFKYGQ